MDRIGQDRNEQALLKQNQQLKLQLGQAGQTLNDIASKVEKSASFAAQEKSPAASHGEQVLADKAAAAGSGHSIH